MNSESGEGMMNERRLLLGINCVALKDLRHPVDDGQALSFRELPLTLGAGWYVHEGPIE